MTEPIRRFDPSELGVPGQPSLPTSEQADVLLAARELETLGANDLVGPTEGFEDRVMAAIAKEPAPRLVIRPGSAVRGGRLGALLLAMRESWGVATTGGRPLAVRAQALAFVLLIVVAAGTMTTVAAVGVGSLLGNRGPAPTAPAPSNGPSSTESAPASEAPAPSATGSGEPSASPEAPETAEPTETPEPAETAKPTPTAKAGETPRPTRTPRPTETPEPGDTPEPSDDHGGEGGDDGGGGPGPG